MEFRKSFKSIVCLTASCMFLSSNSIGICADATECIQVQNELAKGDASYTNKTLTDVNSLVAAIVGQGQDGFTADQAKAWLESEAGKKMFKPVTGGHFVAKLADGKEVAFIADVSDLNTTRGRFLGMAVGNSDQIAQVLRDAASRQTLVDSGTGLDVAKAVADTFNMDEISSEQMETVYSGLLAAQKAAVKDAVENGFYVLDATGFSKEEKEKLFRNADDAANTLMLVALYDGRPTIIVVNKEIEVTDASGKVATDSIDAAKVVQEFVKAADFASVDSDNINIELEEVKDLLQSVESTKEIAEALAKGYNKRAIAEYDPENPGYYADENGNLYGLSTSQADVHGNTDENVAYSQADETIAMNLAGFYALETGLGYLSEITGESFMSLLAKVQNKTLPSDQMLVLARFANATWKAGQPFRALDRVGRDTFRPAALLIPEELEKDFDQIYTAADVFLSELAAKGISQETAADAQLDAVKDLLQDKVFAEKIALALHGMWGGTITDEDRNTAANKTKAQYAVAMNAAGYYALECGIGYLAERDGKTFTDVLLSVINGTISDADMKVISRFANATWKAGQPFRSIDRITRGNFIPATMLSASEYEKDVDQIKDAANKMFELLQVRHAHKVGEAALAQSDIALASSSLTAAISALEAKIAGIEDAQKRRDVYVAELIKITARFNQESIPASVQETLESAINEIEFELLDDAEMRSSRIDSLSELASSELDSKLDSDSQRLDNINETLNSVLESIPAEAVSDMSAYIQDQDLYIDQAVINLVLSDKNQSMTAKRFVEAFGKNRIINNVAEFQGSIENISNIIVDAKNLALINAVKGSKKAVGLNMVSQATVEAMARMDLMLLSCTDATLIRKTFYQQLVPDAQAMYLAVYGDNLADLLNGKYVTMNTLDIESQGTLALQIQIRSEVAAAIKA